MRTLVAAALTAATSLAGCNTATGPSALTPEQQAALTPWVQCLAREAARLDDGFSDPLAIGVAVEGACAAEQQRSDDAMSAGQGVVYRNEFQATTDRGALQLAVEAVLLHRKQIRGG